MLSPGGNLHRLSSQSHKGQSQELSQVLERYLPLGVRVTDSARRGLLAVP